MTWKFDKAISQTYHSHVLKHIPLYEETIDWSLKWADQNLKKDEPILDFGCATGITLRRFREIGFTNLWGVDTSEDMYKNYQDSIINYSTCLPDKHFSLILANWVLHFNQNKWKILNELLKVSDHLIVSEKTTLCNSFQYHKWKKEQGLSEKEIIEKERSLKGVMFLDSPYEYPGKVIHNKLGFYTWISK